jgi:hypothetical protein
MNDIDTTDQENSSTTKNSWPILSDLLAIGLGIVLMQAGNKYISVIVATVMLFVALHRLGTSFDQK